MMPKLRVRYRHFRYLIIICAVIIATGTMLLSSQIWNSPAPYRFGYRMYLMKTVSSEGIRSCQPKSNIFFLKTHKTASSTIMNILFRYGEFHNLTFALPDQIFHYFYPSLFSTSFVDEFSKRGNKTSNIMCHHMRFMSAEVQKVTPNDTFYFTILRNPISQMESSFSYYKGQLAFIKAENLEAFLNNTSTYYDGKMEDGHFAKNMMTFDLGFDPNTPDTVTNVTLIKEEVEKIFDLVLITEYFDESLILLKEALCWSFDDVLSFPLNRRNNTAKVALSLETQEKVKRWNSLDWQLYVYFNNSFWKRVEMFGRERMQREVTILQKRRAETEKKCLQGEVDPSEIKDESLMPLQYGIATILGYNLKPGIPTTHKTLCQRLVTPEIQYTCLLRDKQHEKKENKNFTCF